MCTRREHRHSELARGVVRERDWPRTFWLPSLFLDKTLSRSSPERKGFFISYSFQSTIIIFIIITEEGTLWCGLCSTDIYLLYPCWMLVKRVLSLFLSFLWCVCVCVCTRAQVHVLWSPCGGHEDNPRSQSSSLFETRSLFCFTLCMPGWVPHDLLFQESSCLHLLYPCKCIVITGNCGTAPGFCLGSGTLSWTLKPPVTLWYIKTPCSKMKGTRCEYGILLNCT